MQNETAAILIFIILLMILLSLVAIWTVKKDDKFINKKDYTLDLYDLGRKPKK